MACPVVLLDASVLFSIRVTNLTLQTASARLFQPRWSNDIHEEWSRSILSKIPNAKIDKIQRRRTIMDKAFPDALVTGYEPLIVGLQLPDPDDTHVLAAAIQAHADILVTFNLKDFPESTMIQYNIEAQHPDIFLLNLLKDDPTAFIEATTQVRQRLKNPPYTITDFLEGLKRAGLPLVSDALLDLS